MPLLPSRDVVRTGFQGRLIHLLGIETQTRGVAFHDRDTGNERPIALTLLLQPLRLQGVVESGARAKPYSAPSALIRIAKNDRQINTSAIDKHTAEISLPRAGLPRWSASATASSTASNPNS